MHWSHALLMAELLLKAADKIDTVRPPAVTNKDAAMTDDTATQTPQTIENAPPVVSTDDGQATAATQNVDPAATPMAASPTTQSIIANAVEQPPASPETVAPSTQGGTPETADALLQGISDLLTLAKILNSNPELFAFLKTLISGAKQPDTPTTST